MTTVQIISLAVFYLCGIITGYMLSNRDSEKKIHTSATPYKKFDEKTFFINPVNPEEAFKSSETVDQFISKLS